MRLSMKKVISVLSLFICTCMLTACPRYTSYNERFYLHESDDNTPKEYFITILEGYKKRNSNKCIVDRIHYSISGENIEGNRVNITIPNKIYVPKFNQTLQVVALTKPGSIPGCDIYICIHQDIEPEDVVYELAIDYNGVKTDPNSHTSLYFMVNGKVFCVDYILI